MITRVVILTLFLSLLSPFSFGQGEPEYEIDLNRDQLPAILQMTSEDIAIYFDGKLVPDPRVEVFIEGVGGEEVVELETTSRAGEGKSRLELLVEGARWGDVNIRSGPSTEFDVVDVVHNGEALEPIFQETNGWWHVRLSDGRTGWISGYYVVKGAGGAVQEARTSLKKPILFRPWRETKNRDVNDWHLMISDSSGRVIRKLSKEGGVGREIPSSLSWDGVDDEGNLIQLGRTYYFQLEAEYPNGEKALSPMHSFTVVERGHLRLSLPSADFVHPEFETDPAIRAKLEQIASAARDYPDEFIIVEHFTVDGIRDNQAFTTGEIVAKLKNHPLFSGQVASLDFVARTYTLGLEDSPLEFASLNPDSFYRNGAGSVYVSSVRVDELLYDPSRLKNYTVTVDLNGVVAATTAREWYNVIYDPSSAVSKVKIVKLPLEEIKPVVEEKPTEIEWRRLRSKELALGSAAYWVRTYAQTKESDFTDTTGIGKVDAEFDLTWWGFPFFGWLFGKDLGFEAMYRNNIFDRKTDVKGSGAPTPTVHPNITWLEGNILYRWAFGEYYDSAQLIFKAGYHFYDFDVDTTPLVVVDHTYQGLLLTVGTLLPMRFLLDDLNFRFDAGYGPLVNYSERGRAGGAPDQKWADIIHAEVTFNYHPWDFLSFHLGSWLTSYYVRLATGTVRENYIAFGGGGVTFHIY